jgi:hypothetical protein
MSRVIVRVVLGRVLWKVEKVMMEITKSYRLFM